MARKFLFLFVISSLSGFPGSAFSQSVLGFFPDTSYAGINETIHTEVMVGEVEDLFAVAFDVVYDESYLQFDSITEGSFLSENGTVNTLFIYDLQPGRVVVALSRMDYTQPGAATTADSALIDIFFTGLQSGWTDLKLENAGLMDPQLNPIPCNIEGGTVNVLGPPVGIENPFLPGKKGKIRPNPACREFNIELGYSVGDIVVELLSMHGQTIASQIYQGIPEGRSALFTVGRDVHPGLYLVKISYIDKTEIYKITLMN